ncbi:hypothetical protein ACHAXN_012737 [Cyclotella atomus]
MKNIIYLLISLLCIAGAFEFEEAADRDIAIDNDLDEYYHRNLRFRTDVRTCEDGYICYRDSDCDPKNGDYCEFRTRRGYVTNRDFPTNIKTCPNGEECDDEYDCDV